MKVQQNKMRRENGEIEILDKYTSKIVSNNAPPITDIRRKMITLPGEMVENIDNTVTKNLKEYENQGKEKEIDTKNNNTNVLKSFRKSSDLSLNPYNDREPDSLISRIYSNMESLTPVPRADIPSPICHPTLPSSYPFPLSHIAPTLHQSLPPSFNNTSKNFNTKNSSVSLSLSVSSSHTLPHSEYSRNDSREISSSCSSFNPNLASRLHTTSTTSSYHPSSSSSSYESSSTLPTTSSYPSSSLITSSYPATSFSSTNHDSSQRQVTKKDDINSNNLPHSTKTENKHNQNTINRIISTGNHGKKDFSSDFESSFLSFSSSDVDHDNKKAYVHFEGRGGKVESSRGIMMSRDDDGDRRGYGVKEGDYDERGVVDYNCVSGDVNDSSNNDDSNYRGDNDDNRGLNINYNNNNNDDSVGRYNENGDNNDNNYDNNNTEASDNSIHNNYSSKNRNSNEYQNRHFNNNEKSIRREEINNGKMLKIRNSQESVIENNKGDEKFDTYMHERIMKIENKNCKQFDSYSHNKNGNYDESDKKNECNNDNHGIANDKYNRAMSEKHNDINSINNHANNSKEFQSELYLLQEKKIESLEAQIQELKDLVLSLGLVKKTEGENVNAFSSSEKLSQKSDKSNYVLKSINKNSIHAANDEMGSFEDSENSDFDNKISNKMKKISIQKSREETVKKSMTRNDQNVHHQKPKSPLSSSSVSASVKKTENKVTISSKEFFMILENQRNFDKNCFEKEHNGDFDSFKIREKGMNVDQDETESVFSNEKIHINEMDKINTKFKIKSKAEKLKDPHFNIQNDQDYKIEEGAITFRSSEKTSVGDDKNNNGRNDSSSDVANRNNNLKNNDNDNYNDDYEDDDNNNNNNDDNYNGNGDNNHDKEKGGVEGREYLPKSFPQSNSLRQNKSYRFGEVLKTTETDCPREHSSEQSDRKNLPSDRTDNSQPYIHTPVLQSNGALSGVPERRSGAGGQNNGYRGIYPRRGSDLLGGGLFEQDTGGRVPANTAKDISAPSVLSSSHTTPTTSSSSSSSFPPSFPPSSFPSSSSSSASSSSFPSSFPLRQQQQFTDSVKPNNPNPCSDHAIDEKPLNFRFENDLSRLKTKKSNFYLTNKSSFLLQKRENSDVNQIKFGNMMNAEDGFSRNSEVMHNFRSNQFQLTNSRRIPYNSTSEYEEPTLEEFSALESDVSSTLSYDLC